MSVSRNEVIHLLAMVSAMDNVDTDDPLTVKMWCAMAEQGEWESFAAAEKALLVYRSEQPNFPLRPGHITQVLERVRDAARASFDPGEVPDEAARELGAYKRWIAQRHAEHQARAVEAFVGGRRPAVRAIGAAS